ncbi:plasmid pRiA4b ORF-3 family protein [Pseudonocardia sp.]|uniref:plasmid pRiA4b ORF-3 family protein n=1 Tax=Pseudonocardia sp. TaxID=60912 RepID=UPI003D1425AA
MRTSRLRITLRDVRPTVLRVVDVPASTRLPELHELLQVAVGWTDSHLHQFVVGGDVYGPPDPDATWQRDETAVELRNLPAAFTYLYDLGDGWEHDVEVLGPGAAEPGCRYGEGDCPPEDCGGPPGHAELLAILADPADPEHARMREWVGERVPFDQATTDELVRLTVGEVPASVRLVLDLAAGGVRLTPGGRLPRAFVRAVQERRPRWSVLDRPASIEEDLPPLAALHDVLRRVGLLRLSRGVVRPIRAAGDDGEVLRRLRSWFAREPFTGVLTELVVAVLVSGGPARTGELARRVLPFLGGWTCDGGALGEEELTYPINGLSPVLQGLDLAERDRKGWKAGPSARSLLPRALALSGDV